MAARPGHASLADAGDPEAVLRGSGELAGLGSQASWCAAVSRTIVPTTWRNIGPRSAPGSFGSWTFAPRRAWQTANPPVRALVVIQMSMPNLLMSGVQSSSER